ncbi:MAG: LacI family DNA-binding transcriptional regulator, partial [Pseudomonadota bacterium]
MSNLKRIAEAAQVSVTTVSRILNHDPKMSAKPETRRRVLEIAEQLEYETPRARRDQMRAVAAQGDTTKTVLVATSVSEDAELDDPYYLGIRQGMDRAAQHLGFQIQYLATAEDVTSAAAFGALVAIGDYASTRLSPHRSPSIPLVTAETEGPFPGMHSVTFDLAQAMDLLIDHLIDNGHSNLAMIGSEASDNGTIKNSPRLPGTRFRTRMKEMGWFREEWALSSALTAHEGERLCHQLMKGKLRPDALITRTDDMAIGVYRALEDLGLKVGADISVASLNDLPASRQMS